MAESRPVMRASASRATACLAVGFGLSLFGVVSAREALRNEAPNGAAVFQRKCGACHGEADGAPVFSLPRPFPYADDQLRVQVREGRGEMPAFSAGEISDAEIGAVAAFLRSGAPR